MRVKIMGLVLAGVSMMLGACATVPHDNSCAVLQHMMETCVDYGVHKKPCEDAEVLIYSKAFSQTGDTQLSQRVGNACFLSCQSGTAKVKDVQVLWLDRYGKCY